MCWHAHLECVCEFKKKKEKENTKKKRAYCNESDGEVQERRASWREGADKRR